MGSTRAGWKGASITPRCFPSTSVSSSTGTAAGRKPPAVRASRAIWPAPARSRNCSAGASRRTSRWSPCGCSPRTTSTAPTRSWSPSSASSRTPFATSRPTAAGGSTTSAPWTCFLPYADRPQRGRAGHRRQRRNTGQCRRRLRRAAGDRRRRPLPPAGPRRQGHLLRGARGDRRHGPDRLAPLHPWSARSRPGDQDQRRTASLRLHAVAERPFGVLLLRSLLAGFPQGRLPPGPA